MHLICFGGEKCRLPFSVAVLTHKFQLLTKHWCQKQCG